MSLIQKPSRKLSRLVDPSQKIFEGEVKTTLYSNRVITVGRCWHCDSKTYLELELTRGEARQSEIDEQFQKNLIEREKDRLQDMHQCGLLWDGKDDATTLGERIQRGN